MQPIPEGSGVARDSEDGAFLICASARDAAILTATGRIDLMGGSSLIIRSNDKSPVSVEPTIKKDVFIFWDFDNCPLFKEDEADLVSGSILILLKHHLKVDLGSKDFDQSVTKFLFLAQDSDNTNRPTPQQLHDMISLGYKNVTYGKRGGAELSMRGEVDNLARRSRNLDSDQKPCVCVLTGDRDYSPAVASLRLEGFHDIILVHSRVGKGSSPSLATKALAWSHVRKFHSLNPAQKDQFLIELSPMSADGADTKEKKSTASVSAGGKSKGVVSEVAVEMVIEIQWLAVATHFKNLIVWSDPNLEKKLESEAMAIKKVKSTLLSVSTKQYLLGEVVEEDKKSSQARANQESECTLTLTIDSKEKKYRLKVSGPSSDLVESRHRRLVRILSIFSKDRKLHTLTNGWDIAHRECIIGSLPLINEEKEAEASVLFHFNDGVIIAEIVSLGAKHHKQLFKFLENLDPKEMQWPLPKELLPLDEKKLHDLQYHYAVIVDKDSGKKGSAPLRVRGFNVLLDKALSSLVDVSAGVTGPISSSALSILNAPFSTGDLASRSEDSLSQIDLDHKDDEEDTKKADVPVKAHSGQYSFQDREAGVFYQSFEPYFRRYLSHTFYVDVQESTITSETTKGATGSNANRAAQHAPVKVMFSANEAKHVSACRNYFEQFNAANLQRHQVFFPRVDANKFKEILNHKNLKDAELQISRGTSLAARSISFDSDHSEVSSSAAVDPLDQPGFVSIRIKPPLHTRGIKRMNFPSDVTVTICGPVRTEVQKALFKSVLTSYEAIDCGAFIGTIDIPSTSPLTRQLTQRTSREEFASFNNLLGLRYEEVNSRSTGIAGVAKLYASTAEQLREVLAVMESSGGQSAHELPPPRHDSSLPDSAVPSDGEGDDKSTRDDKAFTGMFTSQPVNQRTETSGPPPGFFSSQVNPPSKTWSSTDVNTGVRSQTGLGQMSNSLSEMNLNSASSTTPSTQMSFDFGGSVSGSDTPSVSSEKRVVRWPHHSFRFMFLGEPLKQSLVDLLTKMREKYTLVATYPHRDKSDHSACLLLEGSHANVNAAAEDINKYMRSIYQQMRCLQLVVSEQDKKELIANDMNRIKDIQGQCGVHVVLDPLPTDMNEASSTYDLRLPYIDHLLFETPGPEPEGENEFKPLRELLSVSVTSKVTGQSVIVSVIDNKASIGGWNWGVNNVLLMLDPSADASLNYSEVEQLDKGEVLVNTENATGKRILRVRPDRASFSTRGIERQAEGFVAALSRGLAAADSLLVTGIAVVAPTSTQYFTDLSVELVQSLTMEAIVAFIRRAPVRSLNKIMCIELPSQIDEQLSPAQCTEMSLLLPAGGDRMALTLLILLEQANDPSTQTQPGGIPVQPTIQLRTCNVPLPRNVRADDLLPSLSKNKPKATLLPHQIPPVGTSPIILRGLTGGLRSSLKTVKNLLTTYAEARKSIDPSMQMPLSRESTSTSVSVSVSGTAVPGAIGPGQNRSLGLSYGSSPPSSDTRGGLGPFGGGY